MIKRKQLYTALNEQRVKASHMLADAIDNQVFIIAEIGQKLRTEYKNYLKYKQLKISYNIQENEIMRHLDSLNIDNNNL